MSNARHKYNSNVTPLKYNKYMDKTYDYDFLVLKLRNYTFILFKQTFFYISNVQKNI